METMSITPTFLAYWETPLWVEKAFIPHVSAFQTFMRQYSHHAWTAVILYVVAILGIQRWMCHIRPNGGGFELRRPLAAWNILLAIFSVLGAIRTVPYAINLVSGVGIEAAACDSSYRDTNVITAVWCAAFVLSKLPEMIDTLFIVLRRHPLTFLHFYHHASVAILSLTGYEVGHGRGLFYMTMNYSVHAIMYTYFALRSFGYRLPRPVAVAITTCQLAQMFFGCYVTSLVYFNRLSEGRPCTTDTAENVLFSLAIYASYMVLFAKFFYESYIAKKQRQRHAKTE